MNKVLHILKTDPELFLISLMPVFPTSTFSFLLCCFFFNYCIFIAHFIAFFLHVRVMMYLLKSKNLKNLENHKNKRNKSSHIVPQARDNQNILERTYYLLKSKSSAAKLKC